MTDRWRSLSLSLPFPPLFFKKIRTPTKNFFNMKSLLMQFNYYFLSIQEDIKVSGKIDQTQLSIKNYRYNYAFVKSRK